QGDGYFSWTKIGFVEGNGTTNAPKLYSFVDASASGKVLYRLKQIDRDGKFEYSQEVEVVISQMLQKFSLMQNYPNPFNPTTTISYQLSANSYTTLRVYDMLGKEVATLVNEAKEAGSYTMQFDGSKLSNGMYFYTLRSGNFTATKKLVLMK
ncbi:MAG: T9SS type A sorting domain-containing protein, partial [Bacteroidota bacterium]|nr:T9SS type A sorting domain-containing protein [Bacteroidota bacterium]